MKRKSSRKKAPPAKRRRMTFRLTVEAQEMIVCYEPHWMRDVGHFEFESPHEPRRPIPISETGYRSHFAAMEIIEAAASPQDFAREVAIALLRSRCQRRDDPQQLSLFE
jgi:hypothetical protein